MGILEELVELKLKDNPLEMTNENIFDLLPQLKYLDDIPKNGQNNFEINKKSKLG